MPTVRTILASLTAAILLGWPGFVFAHATPVSYLPAASAVLKAAPTEAVISFSERIEPRASSIEVFAPDGSHAEIGQATVSATDPRTFSVGIAAAQEGTYAVSWQVVSADDGHFTKGAFHFSVGKETSVTQGTGAGFSITHSSPLPEAVTIWMELVGHAFLIGLLFALGLRRWMQHGNTEPAVDSNVFDRRLDIIAISGVGLAVIGASLGLALKVAELSLAQTTTFFLALPRYAGTVAGIGTLVRLLAAAAFGVIYGFTRRGLRTATRLTFAEGALYALLLVAGYARARVSHAAASHLWPALSVDINFVHVIAKQAWVGSAAAFALVVLPSLESASVRIRAALCWDRFAAVLIGFVGATGAYIVWLHLKSWQYVLTTDWGGRFLLLTAAGLLLFAVRLRIALRDFLAGHAATASGAFAAMEALFGVLLLFTTSSMIITTPPIVVPAVQRSAISEGIALTATYSDADNSTLLLSTKDAKSGTPVEVDTLTVTATAPDLGIGPIVLEPTMRYPGGYSLALSDFSPKGRWIIDLTAARTGQYDATSSFTFTFPDDIAGARLEAETRHFDTFTLQMIGGAVLSVLVACVLLLITRSRRANNADVPRHPDWLVAVLFAIIVANFLWAAQSTVFKGDFQRQCELDAAKWMPSVVMRNGVVEGAVAVGGCSVGSSHFADPLEYSWYTRPAAPIVALTSEPVIPIAGKSTTLRFRMTEVGIESGDLVIEHERLMHVVIVSRDLATFDHVHVEDAGPVTQDMLFDGIFPVQYQFPQAGRYLVAVDFAVRSHHVSRQFVVDVTGEPPMSEVMTDFSTEKRVGSMDVSLTASPKVIRSGQLVNLRFGFSEDGKPVTDLEPYLAAAMHVSVVHQGFENAVGAAYAPASDSYTRYAMFVTHIWAVLGPIGVAEAHLGLPDALSGSLVFIHAHGSPRQTFVERLLYGSATAAVHSHAAIPAHFGPEVDVPVVFGTSGTYKVFGEFKRHGEHGVVSFMVQVEN